MGLLTECAASGLDLPLEAYRLRVDPVILAVLEGWDPVSESVVLRAIELGMKAIDTPDPRLSRWRSSRCSDFISRVYVPTWLEAAGLVAEAEAMRRSGQRTRSAERFFDQYAYEAIGSRRLTSARVIAQEEVRRFMGEVGHRNAWAGATGEMHDTVRAALWSTAWSVWSRAEGDAWEESWYAAWPVAWNAAITALGEGEDEFLGSVEVAEDAARHALERVVESLSGAMLELLTELIEGRP